MCKGLCDRMSRKSHQRNDGEIPEILKIIRSLHNNGNKRNVRKWGNRTSPNSPRTISQSPKKTKVKRGNETYFEFEKSEQLPEIPASQNGGFSIREKYIKIYFKGGTGCAP